MTRIISWSLHPKNITLPIGCWPNATPERRGWRWVSPFTAWDTSRINIARKGCWTLGNTGWSENSITPRWRPRNGRLGVRPRPNDNGHQREGQDRPRSQDSNGGMARKNIWSQMPTRKDRASIGKNYGKTLPIENSKVGYRP